LDTKEHNDDIRKLREKAQDEIDKLLVYLSSGGLLASISVLDTVIDIHKACFSWLIKISWWLFVLSLLFTFFSHVSSKKSMNQFLMGNESQSDCIDVVTRGLNYAAMTSLILGIISFVLFTTLNI
jgi:hypothetical protein